MVYDFCIGRGAKYPVAFLDGWNGTLVCDDYAGYEPVFKLGSRVEAGCLVHARRKFESGFSDKVPELGFTCNDDSPYGSREQGFSAAGLSRIPNARTRDHPELSEAVRSARHL